MKIVKQSLILLLCLGWVFITNYKYYPINSLGALLTYKSGILSIESKEHNIFINNYDQGLEIKIDTLGIPYIYANQDEEVAFGLGYMHAKDRYFQMELMANMVLGKLSGKFGVNAFESDKFWKPFEIEEKSRTLLNEYKQNSPKLYQYLLSYSEGVNTYLDNNKINDPLYTVFDLSPQEWKPEYCLLVTWYMSYNLAYFDYHIEQQELLNKLSRKTLEDFYPLSPKELKTILPSKVFELENNTSLIPVEINEPSNSINSNYKKDIGSNNWAINSKKSKTNTTFLVNDPHLFLTLPGAFYEAGLFGNKLKVYGHTIPGVPIVVSGNNTKISWGITNGEWDLTDRYKLKVKNNKAYFYQNKWKSFEEKEYRIQVRGKGEESITVKRTVHGIVEEENDNYYAQKWYPEKKGHSIRALFNLMQSNNWSEFKDALNEYEFPPQNFIYADVYDTIGIVCAGKLPKRPNNFLGGLLDGTKPPLKEQYIPNQWEISNPETNYLFSANQQPIQNESYFGAHWHKDDYRVKRIDSLLKNKNDWSISDFKKMQTDIKDLSFSHFKEILRKSEIHEKYKYIKQALDSWNGEMISNNRSAFVYDVILKSMDKEAELFSKNILKVQKPPSFKYFTKYLLEDNTNQKNKIINNVFERTDSILKNQVEYVNEKFSLRSDFFINNISFLPGFGEEVEIMGGNRNTINLNADAASVFRTIYEIKNKEINGYSIMAGGQSGKMNSKHYSNQLKLWKKGKYRKIQFSENPNELKNIVITLSSKK